MTWTSDEDTPREDSRDGARAARGSRARWRRTLVGAAVGAVLLGAAGAAAASTVDRAATATALVLTSPDPSSVENPVDPNAVGDPAARNATYLETELVYLTGAELAEQAAAAAGAAEPPTITAARVGDSNVVEITATTEDASTARAQAQSAADLYVAARQQRLADRILAQLTALDEQIAETTGALEELDANIVQTTAQQQQAQTLRTRYADQLAVRDTLQRAQAEVARIAGVVQPAALRPGPGVPAAVWGAVLGALLGALLGAAVPSLVRSADGRLRDEHDLSGVGVPVLLPAVPSAGGRNGDQEVDRAVQLQALQLPHGPSSGGSLAVLSAAEGVGSTFVAVRHARHAAARGTTLLVCARGPLGTDVTALGVRPDRDGLVELGSQSGGAVTGPAVRRAARSTSVPGLWVLAPGGGPDDAPAPDAVVEATVAAARDLGWRVVVDTPPLGSADTGPRLGRGCDRSVLVVAAGRSTVDGVRSTLDVLRAAGATPSAVLVNHLPRKARTAHDG